MFQRFSEEGLAQNSYLIACGRTREAVIVDPRRDIEVYAAFVRRHGLVIAYAIETHTHADFVSGARELAANGARIVAGPGAGLEFPFHEAAHGETLRVGDITLEILHTPGHTCEHISMLVREPGSPTRVLTGDTLFVSAVGRPDLAGEDQTRALADALYDSLFGTLLGLDDDVEVHPGHGAGSLCGAGIGTEPHSTIGRERLVNPFLQLRAKAPFVEAVLSDLPETPPYFARMKKVNRGGPAILGLGAGSPAPAALDVRNVRDLMASGAVMLDLRTAEAFGAAHVPGAINVAFGPKVGYWAGWVLPDRAKLVLMSPDAARAAEAVRQLLLVGVEEVAGYVKGGYETWRGAGGPARTTDLIGARELRDRLLRREDLTVVDVRTPREWQEAHIERAINIPVTELVERAGELQGRTVATVCETGFRSSLAASLLQRAGVDAINVSDGTAAYRMLD
jgi:hydroxyacylglutathione hydrolase